MRLHLKLPPSRLNDFVTELTEAVLTAASMTTLTAEMKERAEEGVRIVLKKYVTAYDICGLPTYCQEAVEIDPWEEVP
jgi:hypothetical protein